jgi:hypothetical protein
MWLRRKTGTFSNATYHTTEMGNRGIYFNMPFIERNTLANKIVAFYGTRNITSLSVSDKHV